MPTHIAFSLITLLFAFVLSTSACTKDHSCENTCLHGGVCDDRTCICPEGYEGTNCEKQETPSRIIIDSLKVTKFPALNSGNFSWDSGNGPDIYFKMSASSSIIYHQSTYIEDADSSQEYTFIPSPEIILDNPTTEYGIQMLDYDGISEDNVMGSLMFIPYFNSTNGFPTTLTLNGALISFELSVRYVW